MKKDQNESGNKQNEAMLKQKTNQDYNNQKPNPNDPNQENQTKESEMEKLKNKGTKITPTNIPIDSTNGEKVIKDENNSKELKNTLSDSDQNENRFKSSQKGTL